MNFSQKVKRSRQAKQNKRRKKGMRGPAITEPNPKSSVNRLRMEAVEEVRKSRVAQWWGESYRTQSFGVPH